MCVCPTGASPLDLTGLVDFRLPGPCFCGHCSLQGWQVFWKLFSGFSRQRVSGRPEHIVNTISRILLDTISPTRPIDGYWHNDERIKFCGQKISVTMGFPDVGGGNWRRACLSMASIVKLHSTFGFDVWEALRRWYCSLQRCIAS